MDSHGSEPFKIVVFDTGYRKNVNFKLPLCKGDHFDATAPANTSTDAIPSDEHGHGTHVATSIMQYMLEKPLTNVSSEEYNKNLEYLKNYRSDGKFCFVIVKYYNPNSAVNKNSWLRGMRHVLTIKGKKLINFSGGGDDYDESENQLVQDILKTSTVVAAIGNDRVALNESRSYYPAMYKGVLSVGSARISLAPPAKEKILDTYKIQDSFIYLTAEDFSNIERTKTHYTIGTLKSAGLKDDIVELTGTSQSTSKRSGELVNKILKETRNEHKADSRAD